MIYQFLISLTEFCISLLGESTMKPKLSATILFLFILSACATQQRIAQPGQVFSGILDGNYLHIKAPTSGTWEIMSESRSGIAFAKGNRSNSESFVAGVSVFALPPSNTPQEFETLIREALKKDANPNRFEVEEENLFYTNERPYACVRYQSVAKDKAPRGSTSPLVLQMDALYCRHPVHPESGFSVIYSHRGSSKHPQLREKAESFIQGVQAVEQGDAAAQNNFGVMYHKDNGVPKDPVQAAAWYRKAADQGVASAQYNLGVMYYKGEGVPKDDARAAAWLRKAADQGDADAQFHLGVLYSDGKGVPKDNVQAVAWYRKAADQGYADAQNNLGIAYYHGMGVPKDPAQAIAWFRKAADQGHIKAQNNLKKLR